ncbi:MAG: DUF3617 domain-containing protein [Erythrobacter sp.]|jgi:hypothetical protein
MRRTAMIAGAITTALLLTFCSGSSDVDADGDGSISASEAAGAAADMPKPEAGLYRATITMTGIDVPGMGASMQGHGGGMTTTNEYCLTEDDVAEGFEEMMKRGQDGSCRYEKFNVAGGKLDAVMLCQTDQGEARMEMKGTATPTGSQFDAKMKMDLDGMGNGTMRFNAKHERIGDCP